MRTGPAKSHEDMKFAVWLTAGTMTREGTTR